MSNKLDIQDIVKDHFKTLKNVNSDKLSKIDIFSFYGAPLIISLIIVLVCNYSVDQDMGNILISIFSIFAGLLLNLIVLIFTLFNNETTSQIKKEFAREINTNITYSILITLLIITTILIGNLLSYIKTSEVNSLSDKIIFHPIISTIILFLVVHFLLLLFMVIKRIYAYVNKEFK